MTPALLRECGASCEGTYFFQKRRDLCEIYGERPGELLSVLLFKAETDGTGGGTKPMRVREDHVQQWMLTESALKTIRNWLAHLADCGVLKIRRADRTNLYINPTTWTSIEETPSPSSGPSPRPN